MVLRIRLARFGKANKPFYNIVVAQARYLHFPTLPPPPAHPFLLHPSLLHQAVAISILPPPNPLLLSLSQRTFAQRATFLR